MSMQKDTNDNTKDIQMELMRFCNHVSKESREKIKKQFTEDVHQYVFVQCGKCLRSGGR